MDRHWREATLWLLRTEALYQEGNFHAKSALYAKPDLVFHRLGYEAGGQVDILSPASRRRQGLGVVLFLTSGDRGGVGQVPERQA